MRLLVFLTSISARFELLDSADVVLATLSGAGSRHFLDYIEGNMGSDAIGAAMLYEGIACFLFNAIILLCLCVFLYIYYQIPASALLLDRGSSHRSTGLRRF